MTKAERKVQRAMKSLNKAFAELCAERMFKYSGRYSACRIPNEEESDCYYNIFSLEKGYKVDYTFYIKETEK